MKYMKLLYTSSEEIIHGANHFRHAGKLKFIGYVNQSGKLL